MDADKSATPRNPVECYKILDISFVGWMTFSIVPMLLSTVATWIMLLLWFRGFPSWMKCWNRGRNQAAINESNIRLLASRNVKAAINTKYAQLGPMSLHEILSVTMFVIIALLWITGRSFWWVTETHSFADKPPPKPNVNPANATKIQYMHDCVAAMFVCMLLFFIPKETKYYKNIMHGGIFTRK
jgi:di/tricarboxylate transporter